MHRFSLIIPIYNLSDYIMDCLSSIEAQSFNDYEVIVIDDGSKDNTSNKCERWCNTHPNCLFFRQKNSGVSVARNIGLQYASGELVWFIDGDDYIHPNSLDCLNKIFDKYPKLDYIQHSYNYTEKRYSDFQYQDISAELCDVKVISSKDDFIKVLNFAPIAVWDMCCRKKLLRGLKFENIRTCEDRLFSLNMVYRAQCAGFFSGCIYNVYLRPDSFTRQPYTRKTFADYIEFVNYSFALVGRRNGCGDGVLCFFNERSNMPQLMKKIGCLEEKNDREWAWQSLLEIIQKHCEVFHGKEVFYVRWINCTHNYIIAWLFLRFRYIVREYLLQHKHLYSLYMKLKAIKV